MKFLKGKIVGFDVRMRNKCVENVVGWNMGKLSMYQIAIFIQKITSLTNPKIKFRGCGQLDYNVKRNGFKFKKYFPGYYEDSTYDDVYRVMYYIFKGYCGRKIKSWINENRMFRSCLT